MRRMLLPTLAFALILSSGQAQDKLPTTPPPVEAVKPPPATAIAATVNGEKISELALFRVLLKEPPMNRDAARKELLNYLIDNLLIDQYLRQLKVDVDAKAVEGRITEIKLELAKLGQDFAKQLVESHLTEAEFRKELTCAMRWDKFVIDRATDKVLRDMFEKNKNMFDGTQMQARHILVSTKDMAPEQAKIKVAALRKQVEDQAVIEYRKMPPAKDDVGKSKLWTEALDKTFAETAARESGCPSKSQGGDLGWFARVGAMVEPFARAAFALKPYQMSEPVSTEHGYHIILATDWRAGKDVKYEEVKGFVMEVYGERLREAVLNAYKERSKVEIHK